MRQSAEEVEEQCLSKMQLWKKEPGACPGGQSLPAPTNKRELLLVLWQLGCWATATVVSGLLLRLPLQGSKCGPCARGVAVGRPGCKTSAGYMQLAIGTVLACVTAARGVTELDGMVLEKSR